MPIDRRATLGLLAALPLPAVAQSPWPSRAIRIIVPFGLGGAADVAARFVAEPLSQALGVPVVIENKPGAGGVIGTDIAAKAAPDGNTLVAIGNTAAVGETLQPSRGYVLMRDLTVVAPISTANNVLVVHPSVPAATLPEFIALLKREPGQWNYAHSGPGTPYHLAGEMLKVMAGIDMVGVAFRGSNEARTAVIGGQVPIMFDGIPTMLAQIEAGRVRALATTALRRDPALPDLPAVAELVPGFAYPVWIGLMMPAGTPAPIVARLHDEITRIMTSAAGQAATRRMGAEPLVMTLPEYDAFLRQEIESLAILARKANLRAE